MEDHRRKWNKEEYEQKAKKRRHDEDAAADGKNLSLSPKIPLKARKYKVDLDSNVGKSLIVAKTTSQSGGYFCDVCDCSVKDSMNFLDHINSRKHQQNMGMGMEPERSTLDQVKSKLAHHKNKKPETAAEYNLESRLKQAEEDLEKEKERKRVKRKGKKRRANDESDDVDPEMAALMGFKGFGSTK